MESSILIVAPTRTAAVERRAKDYAQALKAHGHRVALASAGRSLSRSHRRADCVITLSPSNAAHLVGYMLQRRGIPWIADLQTVDRDQSSNVGGRLVLRADALTCAAPEVREGIFEYLGASVALVRDGRADGIDRQLDVLVAAGHPDKALRILMIGPVNSPHMEHLAIAMRDRGHVVRAGGVVWGAGLPPSILPQRGIPVSVMTRPQPLWFCRLIRAFRPDVIHANWMPFAAAGVLSGVRPPLIAMAWGSDVFLANRWQQLMNRFALRHAALALGDSSALVERLIELGAAPERVALLNWGIDLSAFRPPFSPEDRRAVRASLGLPDRPLILSPRGFKPIYNPEVVLESFERLMHEIPDAHLVLKHQGHEPDLGPLAGSERVHVVGRVPYERMAHYYRAADVCVSIPSSDSSPRSVWEAMASGCVCVLSDLPWVRELIRPDVHALVAPVDADSVAAATKRLLTETELTAAIQTNARKLVEEHRDQTREMERLERLYHRVIAEASSEAVSKD
jgi:glycosyltransferase involved in cell wall biosynthesis